ncbi:PspC domain-containing protein [Streptosporangium longisporum]|uniref:Phage shock protein PspC N-terminal domain-containing protein n=1 Tax=Streptosporangium longisporum TaxID=46187 RepID=A0ABN3XUN4_9ACTN
MKDTGRAQEHRSGVPGSESALPEGERNLGRSDQGRMLTGVCAGLGRYAGIDPVLFRVGFAVLVLGSGIGIILYIAAFLLMRETDGGPGHLEQWTRRDFDGETVLTLLTGVFVLGLAINVSSDGIGTGTIVVGTVFAIALLAAHARGVDLLAVARSLPDRLRRRGRTRPGDSWQGASDGPRPVGEHDHAARAAWAGGHAGPPVPGNARDTGNAGGGGDVRDTGTVPGTVPGNAARTSAFTSAHAAESVTSPVDAPGPADTPGPSRVPGPTPGPDTPGFASTPGFMDTPGPVDTPGFADAPGSAHAPGPAHASGNAAHPPARAVAGPGGEPASEPPAPGSPGGYAPGPAGPSGGFPSAPYRTASAPYRTAGSSFDSSGEPFSPYGPYQPLDPRRRAQLHDPYDLSGYGQVAQAPPVPRRPRSFVGVVTIILAMIVGGITVAIQSTSGSVDMTVAGGAALAVIGAGLLVAAWVGRGAGLVVIGTVLSIALVGGSLLAGMPKKFGNYRWEPVALSEVARGYEVGVGEGTLDLSELVLPPGSRTVLDASVTVGEISVVLPATVRAEVNGYTRFGDVKIDHTVEGGADIRHSRVLEPEVDPEEDVATIVLNIKAGIGDVEVRRAA